MKALFGKKKLFMFSLVIVLMAALIVAGCGGKPAGTPAPSAPAPSTPAPDTGQTFEFSLAHFFPSGHPLEVDFIQKWGADLEKASNGRIKIVSYPGGTLVSGTETYEGVVQGVADIGLSVYAYTRGRFPFIETFLLPGIKVSSARGGSEAVMEGIATFNPKELHDVHHIFTFAAGEGYIMSKKPITTLAQLQGMQIGGTAGPRAEAIRALGATEVILPMPEWYEALDRGIMEAGICPLEALQGFRIGEVTADYMLSTPYLYNQIFFFVMNLDAWNSMPADLQKIFMDYSNQYYENMIKGLWDELGEKALAFTKGVKGKDPQITYLNAADEKKMVELIEPILDKYAAELDGKGMPGAEIVKLAKELTEKYN